VARLIPTIGICGTSFCGSTLVGFVLGSLPGVATIGEDHAIIRGKIDHRTACSTCPPGTCPIWTPAECVAHDYATGWERFGSRVGVRTVVASDKVPSLYRPYLEARPGRDFRPLVLYKSPGAFAASDAKHGGFTLMESLGRWVRVYERLFKLCVEFGLNPVGVDFLAFTKHPQAQLARICGRLGLQFDAAALDYWEHEHHQVRGNKGPHLNIWGLQHPGTKAYMERYGEKAEPYLENFRQSIRPLGGPLPYTPAELIAIEQDRSVQRVLRTLDEISR